MLSVVIFFSGLVPIPEVAPGAVAIQGPVPGLGLTPGLVPVPAAGLRNTGGGDHLGRDERL